MIIYFYDYICMIINMIIYIYDYVYTYIYVIICEFVKQC